MAKYPFIRIFYIRIYFNTFFQKSNANIVESFEESAFDLWAYYS